MVRMTKVSLVGKYFWKDNAFAVEQDCNDLQRLWIHDVLVFSVGAFAVADPTWPFMKYTLQMQQNKLVCETELT